MVMVPITAAMVTRANPHESKPRYTAAGAAADWHGGDVGNDQDVAEATQAVANRHSANVEADYEPQHQKQKADDMVPPRVVLADIGKDYGEHTGLAGRDGTIEPLDPYPEAP